jgi:26S proteasome regulatory subunit N9
MCLNLSGRNLIESITDVSEKLTMEKALADKVNQPASQDAYVFAQVAVATTLMSQKDLPAARKLLDEAERILDGFDSVETVVHAAFYRENASYYKVDSTLPLIGISNDHY